MMTACSAMRSAAADSPHFRQQHTEAQTSRVPESVRVLYPAQWWGDYSWARWFSPAHHLWSHGLPLRHESDGHSSSHRSPTPTHKQKAFAVGAKLDHAHSSSVVGFWFIYLLIKWKRETEEKIIRFYILIFSVLHFFFLQYCQKASFLHTHSEVPCLSSPYWTLLQFTFACFQGKEI